MPPIKELGRIGVLLDGCCSDVMVVASEFCPGLPTCLHILILVPAGFNRNSFVQMSHTGQDGLQLILRGKPRTER